MTSFVAFKKCVTDAFAGEPVVAEVSRVEKRWTVYARSPDKEIGVSCDTDELKMRTPADCRAFALDVYKSLVEVYAQHSTQQEWADDHENPEQVRH